MIMAAIHMSPFSGTWYPGEAETLNRLLDELFERSEERTGPYLFPDGIGFVVPHAGPQYSGAVAASVYRSLRRQQPERIIVLAFPHRGVLRQAAVPQVETIATPLGPLEMDGSLAARFASVAERLVCDHSFEIQLPFLQKAAPRARISPLYVGALDEHARRKAAETLASEWRPGTVFLASSDFTHYGESFDYVPFPMDDQIALRLQQLDFESMDASGSLDSALFLRSLAETGDTVCGSEPIALLLDTLQLLHPDDLYQATLDYQTSGELTGDFHHCVSYAALGYYIRTVFALAVPDQDALLQSAGATLNHFQETGERRPALCRAGSPALQARRGVFVSLHRGSELLGCVGTYQSRSSLTESVPELALSAALDDPRFSSGAALEGAFDIEISVLTPMRQIAGPHRIEVGRHGALLQVGPRSGILLPQVAPRYGWTAAQFLEALERKSGAEAKNPRARLYVFEAESFSRPGLPGQSGNSPDSPGRSVRSV
ncbi:MAG: hypothetical protein C5B51_04875 [Terriglobia bacterium]|nr:MAG: hypothetical protein C5B51_04875 [Terriglobia bacterium]